MKNNKTQMIKNMILCIIAIIMLCFILTSCTLQDPITESTYYIKDSETNYYLQDHTTSSEAVDEFTNSITQLRKYLNSESFVDTGYYMGVNFGIDILDVYNNTVGNFQLKISSYLYTYPYEDEEGNLIYKYYERGNYYDENNAEGTRTLVSALEIHNEAIKKSDFSIEWFNGATNEVMIGLYFDGINSDSSNPGNILYVNIQGYKRSYANFGDTVLFQQMIRLLTSLSVEGLLESLGLQADAGTGSINSTMSALIGDNYKKVLNGDLTSLLFYSVTLDAISSNVTNLLDRLLGVFGRKWDPMTLKYLGFKFSTVANAIITSINADMQAIISPDKENVEKVLTDALFAFNGVLSSAGTMYTYTSNIQFDYGWEYPEDLTLDMLYYTPFVNGNFEFEGTLYIPLLDTQYDALIRTDMNRFDNSTNNVFIEFRDIANGELMIGLYYKNETTYLDITGLEYLYGWIDLEALGFPQVYDTSFNLATFLKKLAKTVDNIIISIVDSILDPESSDRENKLLEYIMLKTTFTEKLEEDIFSKNTETLQVDIELVKQVLEETGAGTYSTRQIINIIDSVSPYSMDQLAIMLGVSSAEVMLEKTYFLLTWDVDSMQMTVDMFSNVGVDVEAGEPSTEIFRLEVMPVYFGETVIIADIDFSNFVPLGKIYTYSGTLKGAFVFSSQETVDLSKLLSATFGESSGLNTPYVLASNAGLSFTMIYDQFVTDQYVDGVLKKSGRSAFTLTVWLTGSESSIIITLASDDVSFNNEVYKDLPAREAELGYVWVDIECVTKNGVQTIPKLKIREDIFMSSMSAYMNNETSITDDVSSFADNDFNLSLTSIITALCKDAYVVPEPEQLEITSSNDTLQSLFRVNGLIGNIAVDAGFTYRVKGLESIKSQYYMYEVGFFDNIEGENPYNTELHHDLRVTFYEDYMSSYAPLDYDFYVFRKDTIIDEDSYIAEGTIMVFKLGAKKTVSRETIEYGSNSFFNHESAENQDITRVKFKLTALNFINFNNEENYYYYFDYTNSLQIVDDNYIEVGNDGTIYIYWLGINEFLFYESGASYYYYDMSQALEKDGDYVYIYPTTTRDLLFEYDKDSVEITEACKTQYAPRTNGSFMGEVRRYFVILSSSISAELGKITSLYYSPVDAEYAQYYSEEDENNIEYEYDEDGVLINQELRPIQLFVMEPCEELQTTVTVNVQTSANTVEYYTFNCRFGIDWDIITTKGYMLVTDVVVAPGMMGEIAFPVRIIVTNREIDALGDSNETATVFASSTEFFTKVPVVDEFDLDPYDYILAKYEYLSNTDNFNVNNYANNDTLLAGYKQAVNRFVHDYFAKITFNINFLWETSYLYLNGIDGQYIKQTYSNYNSTTDTLTRYEWSFDEFGNNMEEAVNEDGGTVYLHTYFFGQLICIKVNIGKRMFSHIKFGRTDDFNVDSFNENSGYDYTINGKYYANYYDNNSYEISRTPIFVFVDNSGNEYEHVFDMSIITGLVKNTSGAYTGTYEILEQYELGWQYTNITNITSSGSYFQEYPYERLYSDTEFTLTTTLYSALSEASKQIKVDYIQTNGTVVYDGFYYVADGSGYAKYRKSISYQDLKTLLENAGVDTINSYVDVDYNNGKAYLFTKDASGNAFVRQENKEIQNRPFYYYYAIGDSDKEVVYLTEDEYEAFWDDTNPNYATVRSMYVFDTAIASEITNTTLNLYGLLRLYYTFDTVNMNSISIVSNSLIDLSQETPADSVGKNFSYIPVRVIVECPILQLESLSYDENDEITGETFTPNKVETSVNSAAGYYLVDPLDPSTLVLPKSLTIYFNDINTGNESSHTFDGIEWAAYFDANNDPVYTVTNTNSQDVTLLTYNPTTKETTIALNLDEIDGTLKFKLQAKIGNEISGYKFVNVCIRILSKDPTMVKFYTGTNKELEVEQIITSMAYGAASPLQTTYYAYYLNTFENFVLPTSLVATFSDGHSTTYPAHWVLASTESESWVYAPNTILTLMTVIGADNDTGTSGIEVNIYLSIIVRNFDLNAIQANNTYSNYYVNLQSTTDANHIIKKRLSDILKYQKNTKTIGYYFEDAGETYYIRISDGTTAYDCDKGVGENRIGLYTFNGSDYLLVNTISVYDFLVELYSSATITVEESTMDYKNFTIINKSTSIYDYTIESYFESTTSNIQLRRMVEIVYNYDNATNENSIRVNLQTIEGGNTYYPVVTDGKVTLHNLSGGSLVMSYAELLTYIITQELAFDFTDWKISEINGVPFNDPEDKDSDNDGIKNELGEYILFNKTRGITLYPIINIDTAGSIKLSNQNETETVTYSYYELMYRLDHLYRHVLITEAESTINNKEFEINDLYKVMDITDLLYNDRNTTYSNKYIIPLGVNQGSYNINARIQFVGGLYYNGSYSENIETATIQAYTNRGVSQYEDGYILANNERASIHATYNGSTIGKQFSYNYTATDALLTTWKVEYISDDSITILSVGDLITAIPAEIIYRTNINDVVIRLSTLTDEGFRIYRHFNISYLSNIYVEGFNGRGTLTISDGVVIIDNIYEYVDDATQYMDAITKYFGSNEYLPKSVSLSTNARTITIDDIEWNILTNWRNRLNTLTYKGVEQTYMAEATILGAVIDGVRYGAVTLRVSIKINTTSVAKLPWSNTNIALNTETVFSGTSRYYVVYFDPILNASSNTITEHGTLTLPADLLVQYEDGQLVTFKNITYKYNSLNTITKIFYTTSGIDTAKMISPAGELQGYSEHSLSKRYLDLTVNLGLSQDLNIRFYFYDRTLVVRTENSIDYTDMMAEIKLDDVNIRNVISNGLSDKLSNYSTQMVSELNTIRIISNLKEIIDSAQEIKSAIQSYLDTYLSTISITAQLSETRMIELLIGWQDTISYKGADLNNLPTSTAYSSNEAYDFALKAIIDVSNNIYGSYLTSIKAIAIGAGTATAKKTRVITQLESYISDITTTGYNQVITNYIAKEYENVFYDILANMNDEELNNAIYYKNMVEAGFNVDTLLKDMLLIKNVKADANAAIKNEVISSLLLQLGLENYEELVAKYTTSEVVIDDYDDVILLAILNGIETAFRYANSLVDTKSAEMQTIMAVVRALLTERLDLEYLVKYYLLNETSAIGESNAINEFTLKSFIDTALDSNRSKKFIRLYFINAMALAMDFTQVSNEEWNNTYIALSDEIIKYSFSSISNYDASVTAIRKGLISGSNVTSLVNNLIKAGVKSFINTVYLESQIAIEVKNLQRLNKILVNGAGQIDEDDYTYTVDPYMNYAIATDRIVIYFDDENGGYPYVTTVVWTLNTLNDNISYNGYTTDLVGSPYVPAASGLNMTVTTKAECIQYAFDTTTPEITTGIYEELAEVVNSHAQFAMVPIENNTYVVYISIKGSARAEVIVFNARKAGSTISVNREDYSSEDVKYFAEFNKFDTTFKLTTFSGFDYNGDIMYTFKNERDMNVGSSNYGTIVRQIMSVYNPFEFSRSTDLPSKVVVSSSGNSSTMDIVWNNIDINPKGNLSNNSSSQIITGNIGSSAGQSISMYLLVAKWEYARFYTKTNSDTTTEYVIDGDTYYIRTMSPISIYFTKYMDYSSEDWYVIYFKASINVLNGNTSTTTNFVFDKEIKEIGLEISKIKAIDVNETGKGFVDKLFYPEDSRLLQYTTSDETMAIINKRMNYVMYWDAAAKNSVINNALPSRDNCIISLGNAKIGQYSLTALKDTSSVISTATYCYEDMNILKGQIVKSNGVIVETNEDIITFTYEELGYVFRLNTLTLEFTVNGSTDVMAAVLTGTVYSMYCTASNSPAYEVTITYDTSTQEATCSARAWELYEDIKSELMNSEGQMMVVMSPNTYYPTDGDVLLFYNHISYDKENINVRLIWNLTYTEVISKLINFIQFAYEDIEESARETYAIDILMGWNKLSKEEQNEMIALAVEYCIEQYSYTGNYTLADAYIDAYKLLAINEAYDITKDVQKLMGGANNNVRVTMLIRVNDNVNIYRQSMVVKVLFMDYTPINYYTYTVGVGYTQIDTIPGSNVTDLYIGVRTDYWMTTDVDGYTYNSATTPYDNISDTCYKLLQYYVETRKTDINGDPFVVKDGYNLIHITNIVWDYNAATKILTSRTFTINNKTYSSNMLSIKVA